MKIVQALPMPLFQQGGTEVLVRSLISGGSESSEVLLISRDKAADLESVNESHPITDHFELPPRSHPSSWCRSLTEWVAGRKPDLVHFHLPGTYAWNGRSWNQCPITTVAASGTPVVCTNHQAMTFFSPGRPPSPLWRKFVCTLGYFPGKARQLGAVRREICVSKHDLAVTRRSFPGFARKLTQLYHSRLDENLSPNQGERERTILNVGSIAFRKGQHILAEAFARIAGDIPDWSLDFVGALAEPACVDAIKEVRRRNGLEDRIRFRGTHPDPTAFYQGAGIYVQPSLLEGLGLSLQEAMFFGIPSVGANTGGIPELIENPRVGRLFSRADSGVLAEVLAELISDPVLRSELGASGRRSILDRGMTRQAMCSAYRELYEGILDR